jgi:outer membrane receptor protein involved in Fe transport
LDAAYPEWLTLTNFEDTTPRHSVNASIGWTGNSWELDAFLRYQSAMEGFQPTPELIVDPTQSFLGVFGPSPTVAPDLLVPVSSYTTLDIRAGRKLGERVTLSLTGRNLLHKEQRQTAGLPVERSILGTVTLAF